MGKSLEVIEDRFGSVVKEHPKHMVDRWIRRHKKRTRVCKYAADEFFSLPPHSQTKVYNTLQDAMVKLSFEVQQIEKRAYIRERKFRDAVKREAIRLQLASYGTIATAEKRKNAYMIEANGMRVERQVVLLRVEAICAEAQRISIMDRRKKTTVKQALFDFNWQCSELIEMLRKDPERL
jgi:hypothetical protein